MVFQSLAMSQAISVIGLDAYFLQNPTLCFFSNSCSPYVSYYSLNDPNSLWNADTLYNVKVPLIKGQLSAAVLMVVACIIYSVVFGVTTCRVSRTCCFHGDSSAPRAVAPAPTMDFSYGPQPMGNPIRPLPASSPSHHPRNQLICPNCRSTYLVAHQ